MAALALFTGRNFIQSLNAFFHERHARIFTAVLGASGPSVPCTIMPANTRTLPSITGCACRNDAAGSPVLTDNVCRNSCQIRYVFTSLVSRRCRFPGATHWLMTVCIHG
eukprot:GHVT01025602.1.p1 GENE.GHVT01025602.1~~GHVT01025602.1.p1  ORF type:complete len:109 (+),score=4.22 GHVT01025602.1:38-364(+)